MCIAEEVYRTLKEMGSTKAPGFDGFPAMFFQRYWCIIGVDVIEYNLNILNEGKLIDSVNRIDIVLIPKIPNPTNLVNFRSISLCSILYKTVAKFLANKLQCVINRPILNIFGALGEIINRTLIKKYKMQYIK